MKELPNYYTVLFNAVTDALGEMERQNYGSARDLLVRGQLQAEGACVAWMEEKESAPKKIEKAT